ncbi:MAG: hypothetical protein H7Y89_01135 [Steroidobacteraceae bacterium]|nr:hypothetical protein [Steroidobacteraceae bacterium]
MNLHRICAIALCGVVAGCAAKKPAELVEPDRIGDVGILAIEAAPADSYPVDTGERFVYPAPWDDNPPPSYPELLLSQRLPPVRVKIRLIVDEGGRVQQTTLLDAPGQNDPAFFAAVQTALGTWTFTPLIRQKRARGKTTTLKYHGITHQMTGDATALPFHQDYEFTFTQRDGIGFVSTQAPR